MNGMNLRARLAGSGSRISFVVLAVVALTICHDAVYLAQAGPGRALAAALRQSGHEYWAVASLILAAIGVACGLAWVVRLHRLQRLASALGAVVGPIPSGAYLARAAAAWARLFPLVAIGFVVQENLEHLAAHEHLIGLGALTGPEYPLALPVLAAISALAATAAAAFSTAERELIVRIATALRNAALRAPRRVLKPAAILRRATVPVLARAGAGRAPPGLLASPA